MVAAACISFLVLAWGALAHDGRGGPEAGETIQQYAQRHMSMEHHIDTFDLPSFFHIHNLKRNGFWDNEDIEGLYGVYHQYAQKTSKDDEERKKKAAHVVKTILDLLDLDKDGLVSLSELKRVGLEGLPNFDEIGAEGHHYDVESEFLLHHEEQYHSTPETQTDESYNHPEDIEHFTHHERIELQDAEKEARFQGVTVAEILEDQAEAAASATRGSAVQQDVVNPSDGAATPESSTIGSAPAQRTRAPVTRIAPPEKQDPSVKFKNAKSDAEEQGAWGVGTGGYKPPTGVGDKMRKNLPYKYKFRRSWNDF